MNAKWTENQIDGPWSAPDIHSREFKREYFANFMDDGVTSDKEWTTATGSHLNAYRVADSVEHYLKKRGYLDQWPQSQAGVGDYILRVAPYTFHIVTIDPTVVIMVPHNFGNPRDNRSSGDIVGWPPKQSFTSDRMLNYIQYGTSFPYSTNILWFSPDRSSAPAEPSRLGDSELEIVGKHIKLVMKKDGDLWITQREQP
jgi:hypothetical protein